MSDEPRAVDAPIIQIVLQRHASDCGVSVLAMICGVSYEEALLALGASVPDVLTAGVWIKDLQKAAKRLGYTLRRRRAIDWEEDSGALNVCFDNDTRDHVVVLRAGLIIETDGTIWSAEDYLRVTKSRPGLLLIPEPIR